MIVSRREYASGLGSLGLGSLGASASGMYRIGPADLFTPGDLQADAKTLDDQVQSLDTVVNANGNIPADWLTSWKAWKTSWDAYNSDHFSGWFSSFFSALNDSNRDDLIRYETQFAQWLSDANGYSSSGPALPAGATTIPSTGAQDNFGNLLKNQLQPILPSGDTVNKVLWVAGGLAVLWIGFQVYGATKAARTVG